MSSRQPHCPIDLIAHMVDCDRGIKMCTELEELTELFTVLNSYDLTCDKIDRQEMCHHMNRIQITYKFWKPLLSFVDTSVIITILASSGIYVSFSIRLVE